MSKVCLIIPPSPFLMDERVFCSLGVLKVAASMEQLGHTVDVLDLSGRSDYLQAVSDRIGFDDPADTFGITATSPQMPAVMAIRDLLTIRKRRVVLGGPHPTLVHAAAMTENKKGIMGRGHAALFNLLSHFTSVVAGDGEKAMPLALTRNGLINADDPKTDLFLTHVGFTDSPWPARHLLDMDSYHYEIEGKRATSIVAQLGCPFGCNFCGGRLSPMLRKIRLRSTESVIAEMEHLYKTYGYEGFMFYDDELNVNPKIVELMKAIDGLQWKLGVSFALRGFVKAELFTAEQAKYMREAGFRWLLCGFESGSPRILKNINKRATQDDNKRMLDTAHDAGINVKALMSIGHPGESLETLLETHDWLMINQPDDFDLTIITVYPGTPYYDEATRVEGTNVWRFTTNGDNLYHQDIDFTKEQAFYKGMPGEYKSFVWTDYLTSEELVKERDWMESELRERLHIPYPQAPAINYERTMGQ